ncbi:SDR family oxidoreductase [Corynebacterium halotolerans]|uniref:NAD(P)-binding domain-containing protein n=1 Tax=Corynebacterium halotolerans YIM 70093 = DSM 44683 TaxID=1121362 RepID=M1NP66_9CORY|nr:SDR family oxidoreductase [Corynebacterium halotolerans]AGF71302.1 hypothetical protein A605_01440 [Corynebacterium halotolerans YIM 70093 = DSM 44683]
MTADGSTTGYRATHPARRVLVTGATGYVGGRLVPELLAAGFTVRATSRHLDSLKRFPWFDQVEAVEADLSDAEDVAAAVRDVDVVFYLVHSMGGRADDFEQVEKETAGTVASAAADAGVSQIVYLSGLHPRDVPLEELSKHMRSRERVARVFLESQVPAVVLRAATLIGSGSSSFEMIRHLTERLPVMVAPDWITNRIEPLSIRDALYYLVAAADLAEPVNAGFDVGGGHAYQFADLLRLYAKERGLRRFIAGVPLPGPAEKLSGWWIALVTPAPASLAIPLAQSMAEDAVTVDHAIADVIPDPPGGLADYPTAVRRALQREQEEGVPTSWDGSWREPVSAADSLPTDPEWARQTVYTDEREARSDLPPERVWGVVEGIGGSNGWYSAPSLWRVRGIIDKVMGGPGLGGRRDPKRLAVGDRLDWWRVEEIDRPRRLVLRAEMKLSGRAWLILEVTPEDGGSKYRQTAVYFPQGLLGRAYWWALVPFHSLIFPVMKRNILRRAGE